MTVGYIGLNRQHGQWQKSKKGKTAMSNFMFRPAVKEDVNLIIGVAGSSGSGKTMSAMRLASGFVGNGKKFGVIDTESRRALHYAEMFNFDHCEIGPPFSPERYSEAIVTAKNSGYDVIVVDSFSHVWSGEGGCLDMQEAELQRMAGTDWKKREACKMAAWVKPKSEHKKLLEKLLQIKAHIIICFRAEEKIEMVKNKDGKFEIIKKRSITGLDGWIPICEKNTPYELTMSFLLTPDRPGIPQPIKLQEQHKQAVNLSAPLDENAGKLLAAWASSSKTEKPKIEPDKKEDKPFMKSQADKVIEFAHHELGLTEDETKAVIEWYLANNDHGGRTHKAGQALINGFMTIYARYNKAMMEEESEAQDA